VIAVSASMRARIVARLGVPPERVHVVANAADHFTPLARQPAPDAPLLCLGHLEPRKNLALVLRALARDAQLPRLVLAGAAKGNHGAELAELARELGVAERVTFRGAFDETELAQLYATCAAVVLPSQLEGFGIVALEAQRARAPLAIARIDALVEVAGSNTPSFAPDDAVDCARAIRTALAQPASEIAEAHANSERWRWDDSARAWLRAWDAALADA